MLIEAGNNYGGFFKENNEVKAAKYGKGKTPLFKAVRKGNLEIVNMLIEAGAYIHLTIFDVAVNSGHVECLRALLN